MGFRIASRIVWFAGVFGLAASVALLAQDSIHRGRKYKAPPPTSHVDITILRRNDSKPIENAAVVFQLEGDKGNMELKTDEDGKTMIDVLPTGSKVLMQVIAKGYQTYGGEYDIDKAQLAIQVKLRRPGEQYSIYENHPQAANADPKAEQDKSGDAQKDSSAKDADKQDGAKDQPSKDQPSDSAKPDSSQPQPR
ncbi:MAG: carboxypeptidase-like regulatory domain-containing protein [Terracidiphilus sp.]